MLRILADHNADGHLDILLRVLLSDWIEFWNLLELSVVTFDELGLPVDADDATLWRACQRETVILITNNRNADGPDSLEMVIRAENRSQSLPVFTLANADRILADNEYVERTARRLMEYLVYLDEIRGADRIYLP
jgi:hypothetical protein